MGNNIPSYNPWVNRLTDEELERLELENTDLLTAYEDFVSGIQDEAYHQYKDDLLLNSQTERKIKWN